MTQLNKTIKLFYSQGYKKVYDDGELLKIPSTKWNFHIHGLGINPAENLHQEELLDEYIYTLRLAFNLEDIIQSKQDLHLTEILVSNGKFPQSMATDKNQVINLEIPDPILESYKFYSDNITKQDWGNVYGLRITINKEDTLIIRAITDGSDGWLEVFDTSGNNLGSALTGGDEIRWLSTNQIRAAVFDSSLRLN